MPWPSNGDYYAFKEEAIKLHAPSVSGVYGIYNFQHHILIGQANNIQEALLRHQKENKFRFRRLQPTGFTFEACPADFKEFRVRQLIWEYQPVIQSDESVGLAALWRSWTTPRARAFHTHTGAPQQSAETHRKRSALIGAGERGAEKGRVYRDRVALAGSGFVFIIVAIVLFALLAENKTMAKTWTRQVLSFALNLTNTDKQKSPVVSTAPTSDTAASKDAITPNSGTSVPAAESRAERHVAGVVDPADGATAPSTPPNDAAATIEQKRTAPPLKNLEPARSPTMKSEDSRHSWTVQAAATTDINEAKALLDRLKAKGYDVFIVEAEIKGNHWYRIRVGNLPNREQAEALTKALQSKEGFRDAFIAQSTKSEVILAAHSY